MKRTGLIFAALGLFLFAQAGQADWTPTKRLTWTSGGSYEPAVAVDSSDAIHVVWQDETPGNHEIYYKRSIDGGTSWSAAKRLTWTSADSFSPALAIGSGSAIHVVWYDYTPGSSEIYYKRSADGGTTWSSTQRLTWTSGSSLYPAIAIDSSNNIHVVWEDHTPGNADIYYKASTNGGTTWSAAERLTWTSGQSFRPAIDIDSSDSIHVVWQDHTPGNAEVYYKGSTDGGTTWSAVKRLTWTSGESYGPGIGIASDNVIHIVWYDDSLGSPEIYYKRSADGGTTWSVSQRLTWTLGASSYPVASLDSSDAIHVVWQDDTPGYSEIYYKTSTDGGTTWSAAQRRTSTSGYSEAPAVSVDSGDIVHIVWQCDTPGNYEIYYKNGN